MPISRREKKIKKLSVRFWISDKIRPREEITRWNICSNFESFKTKFERTEELRN